MPPDPLREQGPPGLATPTQINAAPTSKTVENPVFTQNNYSLFKNIAKTSLPALMLSLSLIVYV